MYLHGSTIFTHTSPYFPNNQLKQSTGFHAVFCNSMPLGARRAYYGKVRTFLSAA